MPEGHNSPSPTAGNPARNRRAEITLKVLTVLFALFFGLAGLPKLFGVESAAESFDKIGWGDWLMYAVGALEVLGAIALLTPLLTGAAAVGFIALMAGATLFSLTSLEAPGSAVMTVLLIIPLAFLARARQDRTRALLGRLHPGRG